MAKIPVLLTQKQAMSTTKRTRSIAASTIPIIAPLDMVGLSTGITGSIPREEKVLIINVFFGFIRTKTK